MIKSIIKSALAIMLAAGLATSASAEVKPYGLVVTHFGMISDSAKTKAFNSDGAAATDKAPASHFELLYRAKLGLDVKQDKIAAKAWVASRTGQSSAQKVQGEVSYTASDKITITMGTALTPAGSIGYTLGGGYLSSETGLIADLDILHSGMAYIEHPGVIAKYAINPYMAAYFGLYNKNTLFNTWIGLPEYGAIAKTAATSGCTNCGNASIPTEGSGMSLSFQGMLSKQLLFGAAYLTSTHDDYNGMPTDNASAINVTGMYFMGNTTLAADYGTTTRAYLTGVKDNAGNAVDGKMTATDMGISVRQKGIGPGTLGVKVASMTVMTTTGAYGDLDDASYDEINTNLHYEIPACEKTCKVGFLYESISKTAKSTGAEARNKSWIGASLAAKF